MIKIIFIYIFNNYSVFQQIILKLTLEILKIALPKQRVQFITDLREETCFGII